MAFLFCPRCGIKLEPRFRFCPTCGERLPSPAAHSLASLSLSPPQGAEAAASVVNTSQTTSTVCEPTETVAFLASTPVSARPPLRKTRNSLRLDKEVKFSMTDVTPPAQRSTSFAIHDRIEGDNNKEVEPSLESSPSAKSPRTVRGKAKVPRLVEEAESAAQTSSAPVSTLSSPISKSPLKGKSKAKKAKHMPGVEPLPEGEEVTDTTGKKWKLIRLLSQSTTELTYEVCQIASRPNTKESNHILKLGAKDGRIFTEQNFLQRAAKPVSVEKWIKLNKMDFMGIPRCVGFGLHAYAYRFLIFPNMGQSLQSFLEEKNQLLSEKTVLQLACRVLDVLQYIHSNEYVHADINAENIYIKPGPQSQVYLVGYCHAFRYCPGGQHVEYREGSRMPHEGTMEFISLDSHKGAGPSRRSDLQSLGYCMLQWHTGTLPWSSLTQPEQVATEKQRFMEDIPALLSYCFKKKKVSSTFQHFLVAVMALQYSEQPVYEALKAGLSAALVKLGGSLEQPLSV